MSSMGTIIKISILIIHISEVCVCMSDMAGHQLQKSMPTCPGSSYPVGHLQAMATGAYRSQPAGVTQSRVIILDIGLHWPR